MGVQAEGGEPYEGAGERQLGSLATLERDGQPEDEEDLAVAFQLQQYRLPHQVLVELGHVGLHRQPLVRRCLHDAHVPHAHQRHVQRARDRSRRQREDVHLKPQRAKQLLLGDAEALPFSNGDFDALICECAFCTFPDKDAAAIEFARVLRPGGRLGLSDVTRTGSLPAELDGLLAWIACLGDAQTVEQYAKYLRRAGLVVEGVENHDEALGELVRDIRAKLLGAELLVRLDKLELPGADFEEAGQIARAASEAIGNGLLGYTLILSQKPFGSAK